MTDNTEALPPLDALFRENAIPMNDRNGALYDAISAAIAQRQQAAPSAQAEPVGWVVPEHLAELQRDYSRLLVVSKDKSGFCTAPIYAAPPAAQAEPQDPLTDDQVLAIFREAVDGNTIKLTRDVGPYEVIEPTHAARTLVNAIVAAARGIGKQESK